MSQQENEVKVNNKKLKCSIKAKFVFIDKQVLKFA